ncbi:MAG: hypothetical protein AB7O44_18610 [Hyphomicrobiaceae bacterium]
MLAIAAALAMSDGALAQTPSLAAQLAQGGAGEAPRIAVAPVIATGPAAQVPLAIRIAPLDALPRNSFLRVRGLPPTVSLSEGYVTAPGSWSVPINGLAGLQMIVPVGVTGRSELVLSLIGEDGSLLAEARSALVVQPPPARKAAPVPPPQQPAQAPPVPRGPVLTPEARETAEKFIARGEAKVAEGNIAVARQFFLRAAQIGLARGALLLAATHDPRELARWGVQGVQPNVAEARKWYERARELGAPEADGRLAGLGGG